MAFQDVIRINEGLVHTPFLKRIARHHLAEDSGHDRWFLHDVETIEGEIPGVSWLFGNEHAVTRTASYSLVSEAYRANDDFERITLILALESAGHIFFERIAGYFEKQNVVSALQYFSRQHLDFEKNHELFEQEMMQVLLETVLPPETAQRHMRLVDRVYAAFFQIFDCVEENLQRNQGKAGARMQSVERLVAAESAANTK